ncbi:MAG: hypothetical protein ACR2N3_02655 [Pyrinomonadaceae bacterium]
MDKLPQTRNENIVVQNLDKEVLIYDLITNKAFCLNETSAIVFNACDGKTSFDELKRKHKLTDDLIHFALGELRRENLIESSNDNHFAGLSRREVIRRVGLASMVALPVISSLIAPKAANAASNNPALLANGQVCLSNSQCQSNRCGGSGLCCSSNDFQSCTFNGDCCSGVACTSGICCQGTSRTCDTRQSTCCAGLTCVAAAGQTNGSCR